jgi:lipid II:glycine glycyltransferase (peptidoglycan interpeptide bridge formation enzyme)
MNIHQTEAHAMFLRLIGWRVVKHRYKNQMTYYYLRKFPILPIYFLKIQRLPLELIDWKLVETIQRRYRVWETVVEVDQWAATPMIIDQLEKQGYSKANDFMLTTKTRIIDLKFNELQLIKAMKPKTRYNLGKSRKNNLTVKVIDLEEVVNSERKLEKYFKLLKQNANRIKMLLIPKNWVTKQWQAFQMSGFVVEIGRNNELVAIATFYLSDTTCSYNLNGSTKLGRKLFAPTLAVWEGMKEGKRRGKTIFDFDGVCDERYGKSQKRFAGFGRFKAGFGGEEVYFPPMYRKIGWNQLFDFS